MKSRFSRRAFLQGSALPIAVGAVPAAAKVHPLGELVARLAPSATTFNVQDYGALGGGAGALTGTVDSGDQHLIHLDTTPPWNSSSFSASQYRPTVGVANGVLVGGSPATFVSTVVSISGNTLTLGAPVPRVVSGPVYIDESGPIQAAIDAAAALAGAQSVSIPAGTYPIGSPDAPSNKPLMLRSRVSVVGAGVGQTVLQLAPRVNQFNERTPPIARPISSMFMNAHNTWWFDGRSLSVDQNFTVSGMTLDGNRAQQPDVDSNDPASGVMLGPVAHVQLKDLEIHDFVAHGIVFMKGYPKPSKSKGSNSVASTRLNVHDNGQHGVGWEQSTVHSALSFSDSSFLDNGNSGADVEELLLTGCSFVRCRFAGNHNNGVHLSVSTTFSALRGVQLYECDINGVGNGNVRQATGLFVNNNAGNIAPIDDLVVRGCRFTGNGGDALEVDQNPLSNTGHDPVVEDCTFAGNGLADALNPGLGGVTEVRMFDHGTSSSTWHFRRNTFVPSTGGSSPVQLWQSAGAPVITLELRDNVLGDIATSLPHRRLLYLAGSTPSRHTVAGNRCLAPSRNATPLQATLPVPVDLTLYDANASIDAAVAAHVYFVATHSGQTSVHITFRMPDDSASVKFLTSPTVQVLTFPKVAVDPVVVDNDLGGIQLSWPQVPGDTTFNVLFTT